MSISIFVCFNSIDKYFKLLLFFYFLIVIALSIPTFFFFFCLHCQSLNRNYIKKKVIPYCYLSYANLGTLKSKSLYFKTEVSSGGKKVSNITAHQ